MMNVSEFTSSVTNYDKTKSEEEWKYVERLLPPKTVPKPIERDSYQTHWRPPTGIKKSIMRLIIFKIKY